MSQRRTPSLLSLASFQTVCWMRSGVNPTLFSSLRLSALFLGFRLRGGPRVVSSVAHAFAGSMKSSITWACASTDEVVNAYYFGQGGRCQNLNGRRATHVRWMQVDVLFRKGI